MVLSQTTQGKRVVKYILLSLIGMIVFSAAAAIESLRHQAVIYSVRVEIDASVVSMLKNNVFNLTNLNEQLSGSGAGVTVAQDSIANHREVSLRMIKTPSLERFYTATVSNFYFSVLATLLFSVLGIVFWRIHGAWLIDEI